MATRKEIAATRPRGERGKFVKKSDVAKYNLPANIVPDAGFSHLSTFQSVPVIPAKIWKTLDEALRHSPSDARAMRRDTFILRLLFARQMAVAQLPWELEAEDPKDPFQVHAVNYLTKVLQATPRLTEYFRNLLEAVWGGRSMIVNNYGFDWAGGKRRMVIKDWTPVMSDKIQFRIDDDQVGYLVNPAKLSGLRPMEIGYDGPVEMFSGSDRQCVVVHKHFLMDANYVEGEFGGGINGVGLRSFCFWSWLHRQEILSWIMDAGQRYGAGGFQIWTFSEGNPESEKAVRQAAEQQTQSNVILFPRPIGSEQASCGLEIVSPEGAGFDFLLNLINDYFDKQIRQLIIGDSSEDKESGATSDAAESKEQSSFGKIVQYDADNLAETLSRELLPVLQQYNFPGTDYKIKLKFNVLKPDPAKLLEAAQRFHEMGGAVAEAELRGFIGLSEPEPGDKVLQKSPDADSTIRTPKKNIGNLGENLS